MQTTNFLSNTLLLLCLIIIQCFSMSDHELKYSPDNKLTYNDIDKNSKNNNIDINKIMLVAEEKNDSENNNDNFENLKLTLINQSPNKFFTIKEKFFSQTLINRRLTSLSVPTSPPNFC